MAGVTLSHGLHPNMVHRWLREQRLLRDHVQQSTPAFVPLAVESVVAQGHDTRPATPTPTQVNDACEVTRIEVQRAGVTVTIDWPVTAAAHCAQALRELLR